MNKYTCIDLFSGAGGLSEGFMQTGKFEFLAHVEWERPMVETLRNNLVNRWGYEPYEAKRRVVRYDIQKTEELMHGGWDEDSLWNYGKDNSEEITKKGLDCLINQNVDIIIGGPPCQAYSLCGRAQDPNSMKLDYRNYLFESFVKVVSYYRPKMFIFENVPGILSAAPGDQLVIERIYKAFDEIGYSLRKPSVMKNSIYCASDFMVPQDRKRVIIIGINRAFNVSVDKIYNCIDEQKMGGGKKTVRDAIGDLPKFRPLDQPYKINGKNVSHELIGDVHVSQHVARYNNLRDINVFKEWISNSMNNIPNSEKLEYYYRATGRRSNHNKYRNLEWDKPSPTVVSHLYKDGLMFIHPDIEQLRTITIREAALLQSFPMDFEFLGSEAYCFKMIGNAVPVLLAKSLALAVADALENLFNE